MKFSLGWLAEFVNVPSTLLDAPHDFAEQITRGGIEVEDVTQLGEGVTGVRTAKVIERAPHPDADKLQVVQVTGPGGEGQVEVVCGATNFEVGDVVAHAPPGATLPGGFTLKEKKLRGVVSNGMLCSMSELGLGSDADGIAILPADSELGRDVVETLGLNDTVIEIKVYPNRGDLLSITGLARDVAAILDCTTTLPAAEPVQAPAVAEPSVSLTDPADCPHYVGLMLEGATDGPSPEWMRARLEACGMRSLGLLVDITNYVMLELGQPLHAFDADRLAGGVVVRRAADGEKITTLDDRERSLDDGDLVIADDSGAIALAGVMGGASTEVSDKTKRIFLEAAWFNPALIRRTAHRHMLASEASKRFARRVDPAVTRDALHRAAELFSELAGATITGEVTAGEAPDDLRSTELDVAAWTSFLSLDELTASDVAHILQRADISVEELSGNTVRVTPPSWRGDLGRAADIAEEIVRLHGYHHVPATMPAILTTRRGLMPSQRTLRDISRAARAAGFSEAISRPFVGDDALTGVGADGATRITLPNPLASDAAHMRASLVDALVRALRHNAGQQAPGAALFEIGRIYRSHEDPLATSIDRFGDAWRATTPSKKPLPAQPRTIGFAAWGRVVTDDADLNETWSVWDVLAAIDAVTDSLGMPRLDRVPIDRPGWHPGRTVSLRARGVEIGIAGQLHPQAAAEFGLAGDVVAGEVILEPGLMAVDAEEPVSSAPTLTKHPGMSLDLAILAPRDLAWSTLRDALTKALGDRMTALQLFDEYTGDGIADNERSLGVRLRLQDPVATLTDADRADAIARARDALSELDATLRE